MLWPRTILARTQQIPWHRLAPTTSTSPGATTPGATTPGASFLGGTPGSNTCPTGFGPIDTEQDCRHASIATDIQFKKSLNSEYYPKGCHYFDFLSMPGQRLKISYFNRHMFGSPFDAITPSATMPIPLCTATTPDATTPGATTPGATM